MVIMKLVLIQVVYCYRFTLRHHIHIYSQISKTKATFILLYFVIIQLCVLFVTIQLEQMKLNMHCFLFLFDFEISAIKECYRHYLTYCHLLVHYIIIILQHILFALKPPYSKRSIFFQLWRMIYHQQKAIFSRTMNAVMDHFQKCHVHVPLDLLEYRFFVFVNQLLVQVLSLGCVQLLSVLWYAVRVVEMNRKGY